MAQVGNVYLFIFCALFNDIASTSDKMCCMTSKLFMNNELERTWKEVQFKVLS
jgi:hypothetical protein